MLRPEPERRGNRAAAGGARAVPPGEARLGERRRYWSRRESLELLPRAA